MSSEDIERRKRLESAVEDDDWSSVIDGQTKLTEEPNVEEEAPTATIIRFVCYLFMSVLVWWGRARGWWCVAAAW